MISIRMRASKAVKGAVKEQHISGAEGLFAQSEWDRVVSSYIQRALEHPKGRPDKIIVTIESLNARPKAVTALPVVTVSCNSPGESEKIISLLLRKLNISKKAISTAFNLLRRQTLSGASLVSATSGNRLDPDRSRGVRVSRLGISSVAERALSKRLTRQNIDHLTVREALVLASKVSSLTSIVAEVCISDDPDYTTGYVASRKYGYVRVPNIKRAGSIKGGRVFFLKEGVDTPKAIHFLEKTPAIITNISSCRGEYSLDEIISNCHR